MHLCTCIYFMCCNQKNVKIKYINTNLFKDLSGNTLAWNMSLILIPYNSHKGSSRPEVFCKEGVLRNFAKFTGKHLRKSLFFNEIAGLRPATLWKKRLWHRSFPVNFAKFLRTPLLQNTSRRLLLSQKNWGSKYIDLPKTFLDKTFLQFISH